MLVRIIVKIGFRRKSVAESGKDVIKEQGKVSAYVLAKGSLWKMQKDPARC
jgi:hypothetical protein